MNGPTRTTHPSTPQRTLGFIDRVMAQVAQEPRPTPARVFVGSVAHLRFRDAWSALATAGHLAFGRTGHIPALVRAQSLLLVLAFSVVVGSGGTLAAAGAIRVIEDRHETPRVERPVVVPPVSISPSPVPTLEPTSPASAAPNRVGGLDAGGSESASTTNKGDRAREGQTKGSSERERTSQPKQSQSTQKRSGAETRKDGSSSGTTGPANDDSSKRVSRSPEPAAKRDSTPAGEEERRSGRGS